MEVLTGHADGEQVEEREWIMMALINISSLLEYGRSTAVLRRVAGIKTRVFAGPNLSPTLLNGVLAGRINALMAKRLDDDDFRIEVNDEDGDEKVVVGEMLDGSAATVEELPAAWRFAIQLTFVMLSHTLRHPSVVPASMRNADPQPIQHDHAHLPGDCPPRTICAL